MCTDKGHPSHLKLPRQQREAGFTLLELGFAVGIFTAFAVTSILAFTTFNRFASNARYETLAIAAAQQKMDQILTTPWSVGQSTAPAVLTTGTATELSGTVNGNNAPSSSNPVFPLNNDYWNGTKSDGTPTTTGGQTLTGSYVTNGNTLYFSNLDTQVLDSRTTVIAPVSGNSRMLSVKVTVAYTYRGTAQSITLYSLRATDDF